MTDTAVPDIEFTDAGLVIPTASAVLEGMKSDINGAFGNKLNFATLKNPQGQLATSFTALVTNKDDAIALFVNQVDPDTNDGFMQDAIARIYFINRKPGLPTVVQCLCVGAFGTVIPVGSQIIDTNGNIYVATGAGTIPVGGSITLSFSNLVAGPIAAPANTVNQIYQAIPGWDTVNNPADGIAGANVETAAEFRVRREQSVAANAHGSLPAIYAAVFGVDGVIDVYATQNTGGSTVDSGSTGFPLVPHSFYVAVTGGTDADVANAIWTKADLGADMNGNTNVTVADESGYSFPQPTYAITFERPPAVSYNVIVVIKSSSALPGTIVADVTAAVTQQFNGVFNTPAPNGVIPATTGQRVRIGSLLLAAQFYGPVATCEGPSVPVSVISILIGSAFTGLGTLVGGTNVLTITTASTGSLTAGTLITATDVPAGTTIVQQLTGSTGGTGTYQMSANATTTVASPEAITGSGSTAQQIGIDQQPVLGAVTVNLV